MAPRSTPFPGRHALAALRLVVLAVFCVGLALPAAATGVLETFRRPLEPPATGGVERVDRALAKLAVHRRLLVIGAHPDDEDTTLLALVARGMGGEVAYLSLTRGEGGQDLIGPELGPALGLIRSRELLAARQIDGARQFFSRAYDFGYTRSLPETLGFWPEQVLLEDAVRVIRRFRPQVVVAVFPADERAGHGQHQASGLVAEKAYRLAADPAAFPELAAEGLPPWRPAAFYRAAWWDPAAATVEASSGVLEPYSGRSVLQLALASRSLHRSQDMGQIQPLGPGEVRLSWVDGGAGPQGDTIFAGVDTSLAAIAALLPDGEAARGIGKRLAEVEELARRARAGLSASDPGAATRLLSEIVPALREARAAVDRVPPAPGTAFPEAPQRHAAALLDEKLAVAEMALAAAAGVAVDAVADRATAAPGDGWSVEIDVWMTGGAATPGEATGEPPVELQGIELASPAGIDLAVAPEDLDARTGWAARFRPNADLAHGFFVAGYRVGVPPGAPPTEPYFLARPLRGALYDWSAAPPELRGEPFGPPPLVARFRLTVGDVELAVEREVAYRYEDQALGEVREPLRVVPRLEVAVSPELVVWPTGAGEPRELLVTVTNRGRAAQQGAVELTVPAGWPAVAAEPFSLAAAGEAGDRAEVRPRLRAPAGLAPGDYRVDVAAISPGGQRYALALPVVDYPHIRATPYPEPAAVRVAATDLALPPLERVGYVRGASDRVPEALAEVGVPIHLLSAEELLEGDLGGYDAIVVGSRAYETDPALVRANPRLLDYARRGGLVIVQYQQYPFVRGGFAPYPLDIARPHDRITDETAPVRPLIADHPVFHRPNEIGAADWRGWVQERGLYFPHTWDAAYTPLVAMTDPGQPEQHGALLLAPLGDGAWVYTGIAFFRQLPAGVPGAYRLFANLLALGNG